MSETLVLKAISDPTRRSMLDLMQHGPLAVGDLVSEFDMSQPAISQHLNVLKEADLVSVRQEGRKRLYSLNADPLREVAAWLETYAAFWDDKLSALEAHLAKRSN